MTIRLSHLLCAILAITCAVNAAPPVSHAQEDSRYLTQKRDLAGLLGQVHFIRTVCNGEGDQYWRNFMRDFLELEAVNESRRSLFVKAFNHGYRYQSRQLTQGCSASAVQIEIALAQEGRRLAERIATGYLN
ncbi:MAG: TIGR02301 family protein [Hirschia sp.]|mgnify:CR=1 FL=1|nr:TIGR02301 family protein [Hirschia sp.]MBF18200.1 TIGR02301 family protein [Hirschia sp.]|tara:strand:- start:103 stop:498 length:396 start_codon:yes stop_codon:yes gene_type:complete